MHNHNHNHNHNHGYDLQNEFPKRLDITIVQGSIFQVLDMWWVKNLEGVMTPMDLTGYTAAMQIRTAPGTEVVAELTTENARLLVPSATEPEWETTGIHVFSDTSKVWNIWTRIPATDTVAYPTGVYEYDLALVPPGNPSGRFAFRKGQCCIEAEVTK